MRQNQSMLMECLHKAGALIATKSFLPQNIKGQVILVSIWSYVLFKVKWDNILLSYCLVYC